jgi:stalled ribosome alternative rescue factor ArfA
MSNTIEVVLPKDRNPIARELRSGKYRKRVERNSKGKGSYRRQDRNRKNGEG